MRIERDDLTRPEVHALLREHLANTCVSFRHSKTRS